VSFSKTFISEKNRVVVAYETIPNILSRIFGTCYKIDQLPFWSVDSYLPCMYVLLWIGTTNLFILQMFPTTVGNSWELEDIAVYIYCSWLIRPIDFTMKLIIYDL
jgi:hypothetical protein